MHNKYGHSLKTSIYVLSLCIGLYGCNTTPEEPYVERPVEELYNEGKAHLDATRYEKAASTFDEIERQHPYSEWGSQAQLMSSYAYYCAQKYEKALTGLESFIALHPTHPDAAYAHYLRGLCYYEQTSSVQRDQKVTGLALDAFRELIKKYPGSRYARNARIKIDLLRDHLAAREMDVGRYYQRRKSYAGAINRFKEVVLNYQNTTHVEEALHRLVEIFLSLGLNIEAQKAAAVLGHNFPGSPWYADSYRMMQGIDVRTDDYQEDMSNWMDSIVFQKKSDKPEDQDLTTTAEIEREALREPVSDRDLAKPIERLNPIEGYEKAKQKMDEEASMFEKMGNWFKAPSHQTNVNKPSENAPTDKTSSSYEPRDTHDIPIKAPDMKPTDSPLP